VKLAELQTVQILGVGNYGRVKLVQVRGSGYGQGAHCSAHHCLKA